MTHSLTHITSQNNAQPYVDNTLTLQEKKNREKPPFCGKPLISKAQRQGDSIKNLLKPSLPIQSLLHFSGSLGFKNLGRITTGSAENKIK